MTYNSNHAGIFERITNRLRGASVPTGALIADAAANCCVRLPALANARKTNRIRELINTRAWLEASLILTERELPPWKLRRLFYEDGEWHVSLSKQSNIPIDLDDMADGHHADPSLGILTAFVEARRRTRNEHKTVAVVPRERRSESSHVMCCDNFK
jgi:hypothetical protein